MTPLFDITRDADGRETIRPHFADAADVPRLTRQNERILAMLRQRPHTNAELVAVGLNYRARISEIRAWLEVRGETIVCDKGEGGLNSYRIATKPVDAPPPAR